MSNDSKKTNLELVYLCFIGSLISHDEINAKFLLNSTPNRKGDIETQLTTINQSWNLIIPIFVRPMD